MLCRSRRKLENDSWKIFSIIINNLDNISEIGVDTTDNGPSDIWGAEITYLSLHPFPLIDPALRTLGNGCYLSNRGDVGNHFALPVRYAEDHPLLREAAERVCKPLPNRGDEDDIDKDQWHHERVHLLILRSDIVFLLCHFFTELCQQMTPPRVFLGFLLDQHLGGDPDEHYQHDHCEGDPDSKGQRHSSIHHRIKRGQPDNTLAVYFKDFDSREEGSLFSLPGSLKMHFSGKFASKKKYKLR